MGTEEMQAVVNAVEEWQDADSDKRAAIVLTLQNNGEGDIDCGLLIKGGSAHLIAILKEALMNHDCKLAKLIQVATKELMNEGVLKSQLSRIKTNVKQEEN